MTTALPWGAWRDELPLDAEIAEVVPVGAFFDVLSDGVDPFLRAYEVGGVVGDDLRAMTASSGESMVGVEESVGAEVVHHFEVDGS